MRHFSSFVPTRRLVHAVARVAIIATLLVNVPHVTAADTDLIANDDRGPIWKTVLSRMPETWKSARRVVVHWVSNREMDRLVADDSDGDNQRGDGSTVQGFYDRAKGDTPATITIRADLPADEAKFVLSHEFAHMVWDDVLLRSQRADYRDIWSQQRHLRKLVSRYAGESPEEGFAEAVASYIWKNAWLKKRDDLSYDFVADIVRDAEEKAKERSSRR